MMVGVKKKNPAAVALGRLGGKQRAKNLTAEERKEGARRAGKARLTKMTPAERRRIAMLGAKARLARLEERKEKKDEDA